MKAILLLSLWARLISCQAIHSSTTLETNARTEVLNTDADYRRAVLQGDAAKLGIIFADDILIVHSDGGTDTKVNFLDAISSGRLKLTSYERNDVQVRIYGSVAVLFSKTIKMFLYRGSPGRANDSSIVTFSKVGNRWRIVAMQNTPRSELDFNNHARC